MMKHAVMTAQALVLALFLAVSKGSFAECQKLIEQGAYVDARDESGNSALMTAASSPKGDKLTRMLLKTGAAVNGTNLAGETALFPASRSGTDKAVKLLLKHRADPNVRNHKGETALMLSAGEGFLDIVKALVDAGADVNVADNRGETALMISAFMGHLQIVETLLSAGALPLASTPYCPASITFVH